MCDHWFALEHVTCSTDTSCFLFLVGSLPPEEQNLWFPNQVVHDPDTWTTPHLLQLQREYDILVDKYGCSVQKMFTVQDPTAPPTDILHSLLSNSFTRSMYAFRSYLNLGILDRFCHHFNTPCLTDHEKLGTFENKH